MILQKSLEDHVRAGCSATRGALCRAVTRAVWSLASIDCGAGKPSAESFDTASTSSTHGAAAMSPGATLEFRFLSLDRHLVATIIPACASQHKRCTKSGIVLIRG